MKKDYLLNKQYFHNIINLTSIPWKSRLKPLQNNRQRTEINVIIE